MTGEANDFEYDGEDLEASDEMFESDEQDESDETFEASDESFEASDESFESDESDEGWEASDEGEGVDEADGETDEALDEAISVGGSARVRRQQDTRRRDQWARRVAADQRVEQQRATSTQRSITKQIQAIQPGAQAKVYSVGPLQGAGVVTAVLPNGRRSRMRIMPTMAPISEVNRLRGVIAINDRRQAKATSNNSRAIMRLGKMQTTAVRKLSAEQVKSDKDLRRRLVEGDNRLDKRITKELSGGSGILDKHGKRLVAQMREQRMRSIMNSVTLATSLPFWSAYGTKNDPLSRNNLTMAASTAGWLVGDELIDQFAGKSGGMKGFATIWSYLAWAGNGATMHYMLKDRQHQRFISGITPVTAGTGTVSLTKTSLIAKDFIDDFKSKPHDVVATIVGGTAVVGSDLRAEVSGENLKFTIANMVANTVLNVAWMIDTGAQTEVKA